MIATLAMYDWPEQSAHWDRFWHAVRDALRAAGHAAPDDLTRGESLWDHWRNPDLVLGQTCGLPYRRDLHRHVQLVGTLDHALPDTPPGHYHSVLVARADAPRDLAAHDGATLAVNALDSQSGWAAPLVHAGKNDIVFSQLVQTGAHRDSARAVAEGRADIAGIDAETWRLIERYLPDLARRLRIVARTDPTPGLPLITGTRIPATEVAAAVEAALHTLPAETLEALNIRGLIRIPTDAYLAVATPDRP